MYIKTTINVRLKNDRAINAIKEINHLTALILSVNKCQHLKQHQQFYKARQFKKK